MRSGRTIALLGSWWLTALLLLSLVAAYLSFSFGRNPFPAWSAFVFHSAGGIAIVLGLIVNLGAATVRIVIVRLRRPVLSPEEIRAMDIHGVHPLQNDRIVRTAAERFGVAAGTNEIAERGVRRVSGTWSFLPGTIFRLGLMVTLIGLLMTAHGRRTYDTALREGERKDLFGSSIRLAGVIAQLPTDHLQVGEDGTFLLSGVSARIDARGRTVEVTPGFPTRINGLWYRVSHLGYSQEMTVNLRGVRHSVTADLDLLPPGRSSIVPLTPGTASLIVSLDPERTIEKGLLKGRQYNLAAPAYRVAVQEGRSRKDDSGRRMKPGDRAAVGPAEVALGDQGLVVRFQIVSDAGLPFLYAGVVMALAGLASLLSRFFWYEREFAMLAKDGMLFVGSRDEFFKKWGIHRFERWKDELAEEDPSGRAPEDHRGRK